MRVTLVRSRTIDEAVYKVARTLAEDGHEVKLLVWDRQRDLNINSRDGYQIIRFTVGAPYDTIWALLYLPLWWAYELYFLLRYRADVIHACDFDTLPPALVAKLLKRMKLCYQIYDFYASNLPDGRFGIVRRLIRTLTGSLEKFCIRFAEVLFLADEGRYEEVKGARISKLVCIYNSPPDFWGKIAQTAPMTTSGLVIFYAGVLSPPRGLQYMIQAVEELDDVALFIGGAGPEQATIEKAAGRCSRIKYLGRLPSYEDIIKRTMAADVLFRFSDPAHHKTKYESPNKLFEAMMCGKPIIVSEGSLMSKTVEKEHCGLCVPYGDVAALKDAILTLKNDPDLRRRLGENGRNAYEERYSWALMQNRLVNTYRELASI